MKKILKKILPEDLQTHEFCNKDVNKLYLMLRKRVYPYEHMNIWERFNEISLPGKKRFYISLNIEDITAADHKHEKRVWSYSK